MTISRRTLFQMLAAAPIGVAGLNAAGAAFATQGGGGGVPGLYQFKIGDAVVTALLDGHIPLDPGLLVGADLDLADQTLKSAGFAKGVGGMSLPINGYLVEQGDQKILIDAGAADTMGPAGGGVMAALAAANVTPAQIDLILLTHLHLDHAAGLVDADGRAVFPNAEVVVAQAEWDFWHDDAILAAVPEANRGFFDIARRSVAPYGDRMRFFGGEAEVASGVLSVPMPGHTPGHSGFQISSGDNSLLVWGDLIHITALQFAHPDWTIAFDADPALTVESRRAILDRAAADGVLVAGMHLDFPGLGRVIRNADGFGYQQSPWQALL